MTFVHFLKKKSKMQKISEDSKNSHLKFSNSLKSNVKNSIFRSSHLLNSKNLIFSSRRGHDPGLQGCNWWVDLQSSKWKHHRWRAEPNKTTLFFWINHIIDIDTQKKEIWTCYQQSTHIGRLGQTKITKEQGKVDPCRPPPRPLSAASLTAVCRTTHRSVAAARSATHGCRWWRPGGKEIVKDLDGYDENLREMDLFEQRMEKAKLSKELQKS